MMNAPTSNSIAGKDAYDPRSSSIAFSDRESIVSALPSMPSPEKAQKTQPPTQ